MNDPIPTVKEMETIRQRWPWVTATTTIAEFLARAGGGTLYADMRGTIALADGSPDPVLTVRPSDGGCVHMTMDHMAPVRVHLLADQLHAWARRMLEPEAARAASAPATGVPEAGIQVRYLYPVPAKMVRVIDLVLAKGRKTTDVVHGDLVEHFLMPIHGQGLWHMVRITRAGGPVEHHAVEAVPTIGSQNPVAVDLHYTISHMLGQMAGGVSHEC